MSSIRLPVGTPAVRGYLFYAYPLSILAGHGDAYLPWLYSTFIQLYHLPGRELKFFLHPFSPGPCMRHSYFATCPWLDVQSIDQSLLTRGAPLSRFLRHALDHGLYPQVDVDYSRLPDRGRTAFLHEVLVCGYDRASRVFEVTGYDDRGRFQPSRISFDTLDAAAAAAGRASCDALRHSSPPDWLERDLTERPRLFLYRYIADAAYELDAAAVAEQLWDYLEAADTSSRYRAVATPVRGLWGIGTYVYLMSALRFLARRAEDRGGLDIPLRILWEHKRLMAARLAFLELAGCPDPAAGLARRCGVLVEAAYGVRLTMLRWRRERRDDAVEHAVDTLQEIAAGEHDLYAEAIRQLEKGSTTALRAAA